MSSLGGGRGRSGLAAAGTTSAGGTARKAVPVTGKKPAESADKFAKAFAKAAADVASNKRPAAVKKQGSGVGGAIKSGKTAAKKTKNAQYRNLVDPATQEQKKQQYLNAFDKLQGMSLQDMQVELIVCIRAQHYRDALMYSQIIVEKDPNNALVAQFQPLLATLSVQDTEAILEESDSSCEDEGVENINEGINKINIANEAAEESSSDEDPETAWMWSPTWRTDPD